MPPRGPLDHGDERPERGLVSPIRRSPRKLSSLLPSWLRQRMPAASAASVRARDLVLRLSFLARTHVCFHGPSNSAGSSSGRKLALRRSHSGATNLFRIGDNCSHGPEFGANPAGPRSAARGARLELRVAPATALGYSVGRLWHPLLGRSSPWGLVRPLSRHCRVLSGFVFPAAS